MLSLSKKQYHLLPPEGKSDCVSQVSDLCQETKKDNSQSGWIIHAEPCKYSSKQLEIPGTFQIDAILTILQEMEQTNRDIVKHIITLERNQSISYTPVASRSGIHKQVSIAPINSHSSVH